MSQAWCACCRCSCPRVGFQRPVVQEPVSVPGFVEPHTPGSGDPREVPLSVALRSGSGSEIRVFGPSGSDRPRGDGPPRRRGRDRSRRRYLASGRANLDVSLGNDSSLLGDDRLLAVTQNASVDVPVLAIGGSNGMTPEPKSFAGYLDSIATPRHEQEVVILEGYAHADVVMAERNEAVPLIVDWIERQTKRKRPGRRLRR